MEFLQSEWGWTVVFDLFLGGLGAASFVIAALVRFIGKGRFRTTEVGASWVGAICIIFGVVFLLLDVGQPLRAMLLPISFSHFTSWMTFGAWFMLFTLVFSGVFALLATNKTATLIGRLCKPIENKREIICTICAAVGSIFAAAVTVYTGFLVASAPGVPFWNTWLLPATFMSSSFFVGSVVVSLIIAFKETASDKASLTRVMRIASVVAGTLTAMFVGAYLQSALNDSTGTIISATLLTEGTYAWLFWGGVVVVGLGLPLAAIVAQFFAKKDILTLPIAAAAGAIIGGLSWRFLILAVGLHAPLASPSVLQMFDGITFLLH